MYKKHILSSCLCFAERTYIFPLFLQFFLKKKNFSANLSTKSTVRGHNINQERDSVRGHQER